MNPKWVYPDPTNTDEPVIVSRCCPTCDAIAARLAEAERLLYAFFGNAPLEKTKHDAAVFLGLPSIYGAADSADDDPYRRAAQQSLDAEREGLARARADGTAERAVDDLLKILGK
jgi:hypothetical protein